MARSKYIWCITYDDYTVEFIKAQTIWQILECGELKDDVDNIVNINRIELAGGWAEEEGMTNIPFQD